MTQANRQTTAQSTAHFGAKATGKLTNSETDRKARTCENKTDYPCGIYGALEATREKDQPVLDYLKDK